MNKKLHRNIWRFIRHMQATYKNKLAALAMVIIGIASAKMSGDATFMMFVLAFGLPLFFSKRDWFYNQKD